MPISCFSQTENPRFHVFMLFYLGKQDDNVNVNTQLAATQIAAMATNSSQSTQAHGYTTFDASFRSKRPFSVQNPPLSQQQLPPQLFPFTSPQSQSLPLPTQQNPMPFGPPPPPVGPASRGPLWVLPHTVQRSVPAEVAEQPKRLPSINSG